LADQCQSKPEPAEAVAANASSTASIIICSRNAKRLEACLASLAPTIDARHQVIVVAHETNGHDPELKRAAERHGAASIPYRGGFHFARMNELGASVAQGSVLVLMNDDVRPIATDWLETMLAQAARPEIGVVGAMLRYPSGAIQHAGIVIGDMLLPTHPGRSHRDSPYWPWLTMTREVSAVTGACLAVRRSVWNELGGFDKRFPVNYNDVDFCLRARRLGYRVLIETRAILIHEGASTRVPEVRASERELFWELWSDVLSAPDPYFNPQLEIRDETIRLPRAWPRQR
jgi:GT2 family glycosyltransferase